MITEMEMDLLRVQAKNLVREVRQEYQTMKTEGREQIDATQQATAQTVGRATGEEESIPDQPSKEESATGATSEASRYRRQE